MGFDRKSTFRVSDCQREGEFFSEFCDFHIKNKLKSEIFNEKKVYNKHKFFSVISNWEILTKNLVTFKRKKRMKEDEKLQFWGDALKNLTFRGCSQKTNIERGLPRKWDLESLSI